MGKAKTDELHEEQETIEEALAHNGWRIAMHEENHALMKNNTWSLVPKMSVMNIVNNK